MHVYTTITEQGLGKFRYFVRNLDAIYLYEIIAYADFKRYAWHP